MAKFGLKFENSSGNAVTGLTVKLIQGATEIQLLDGNNSGYYSNDNVPDGYYELWDNRDASYHDSGFRCTVGQVTAEAIKNGAVNGDKIADEAVTGSKIAGSAIGSTQLIDGAVIGTKIGANAVSNSKLAQESVNDSNIMQETITGASISDGTIAPEKLNADAKDSANLTHAGEPLDEVIDDLDERSQSQYSRVYQVSYYFTATGTTKSVTEEELLALEPDLDSSLTHISRGVCLNLDIDNGTSFDPIFTYSKKPGSYPVVGGIIYHLDAIDLHSLVVGKTYILSVVFKKASFTASGGSQT